MSPRLSAQAIVHLLDKTGVRAVLTASNTEWLADEVTKECAVNGATQPTLHQIPAGYGFLHEARAPHISVIPSMVQVWNRHLKNAVILHSSGTTGAFTIHRVVSKSLRRLSRAPKADIPYAHVSAWICRLPQPFRRRRPWRYQCLDTASVPRLRPAGAMPRAFHGADICQLPADHHPHGVIRGTHPARVGSDIAHDRPFDP